MTTEFNDRAAYDRPLNDRLSDVPADDELDARDRRADDKAVTNDDDFDARDRRLDDEAVTNDDDFESRDRRVDDEAVVDNDEFESQDRRVDDKAVINDDEPTFTEAQQQPAPQQEARTNLFEDQEIEQFRVQWREVQACFVDEPRTAVRDADSLLSTMMDELKSHIDEQKRTLDGEWNRDTKDTEELRVAMQRYRSLFDQILSV